MNDEYDEGLEVGFTMAGVSSPFGPIFTEYVNSRMEEAESVFCRALYSEMLLPTDSNKYARSARFIPGSTFDDVVGPRPGPRVMIIGKMPDDRSAPVNRTASEFHFTPPIDLQLGYTKDFLVQAFRDAGIPDDIWKRFYVTSMCRFPRIDIGRKKTTPAGWIKEGLPFIEKELHIIKPDVIVCMGSDATKKIVGSTITKAVSNVFEYDIDGHVAKVVCVYDPKKIIEDPEERPLFMSGLESLKSILIGGTGTTERSRDGYHYVESAPALKELVDSLIERGVDTFSIDCEWGGKHYLDTHSGLRTVQFSWSPTEAAIIILRRKGMRPAFKPYISSAYAELRRLFHRPGVKIVGHGISADFPWLKDSGLDLSEQLYFDTMLASHLFEPTMSHKLEDLAAKHIHGWVRQDYPLSKWIDAHKSEANVDDDGYAHIPDDLLHPYGGDDVVSTYLLFVKYRDDLKKPENKRLADLFYTLVMPALLPLINIEMTGVYMDRERVIGMQEAYSSAYALLLERFQTVNDLPFFNPNSADHKQQLLFKQLGLKPVKTTDDPPLMWDEVEEMNCEHLVSPAVDGETLEILSVSSTVAKDLYDLTLLATVLKNQLVPPSVDSYGNLVYSKGFAGFIKPDGRIHTRISQMLKTGRLASLDPNIMNIANRQEVAVQGLFSEMGLHVPKLRSAFTVQRGKMLVVADYKQAEIAALAYASGDEHMIAAVKSGEDIHSVVAKQMFQLDCTVKEVKKLYKNLRIASKSIVFGLLYGRGAKAIAREVEKAGVKTTVEEAQQFIDTFMKQFPKVAAMITTTHQEVEHRGWVETLWGRRAYYPSMAHLANGKQLLAAQRRKGFNLKIQGYVGDLLRSALVNFWDFKHKNPEVDFNIILTVHDSIMAEVGIPDVEHVVNDVFPLCMSKLAICPSFPFQIAVDLDVSDRWDEKLYIEDFLDRGFSQEFAEEYCKRDDDTSEVIHRPAC